MLSGTLLDTVRGEVSAPGWEKIVQLIPTSDIATHESLRWVNRTTMKIEDATIECAEQWPRMPSASPPMSSSASWRSLRRRFYKSSLGGVGVSARGGPASIPECHFFVNSLRPSPSSSTGGSVTRLLPVMMTHRHDEKEDDHSGDRGSVVGVCLRLQAEDFISAPLVEDLTARLLGKSLRRNADKKQTSSEQCLPGEGEESGVTTTMKWGHEEVLVALVVDTLSPQRSRALEVLMHERRLLFQHVAVIDVSNVSKFSCGLAWSAAKAAGNALRIFRLTGRDIETEKNLGELRRFCTRIEDIELQIEGDFAMLTFVKFVEESAGTLRRVALAPSPRWWLGSNVLQTALSKCRKLCDVESIEFKCGTSTEVAIVKKLLSSNPSLTALRVVNQRGGGWAHVLRAQQQGHPPDGGGFRASGLVSLTLLEPHADYSDAEGEDEGDDGVASATSQRRRNRTPRMLASLSPAFAAGMLTSLSLEVGDLYQLLPFPFVTDANRNGIDGGVTLASMATFSGRGAPWSNPLRSLKLFKLKVECFDNGQLVTSENERRRILAHKRAGRVRCNIAGAELLGVTSGVVPEWGTSNTHGPQPPQAELCVTTQARREFAAFIASMAHTVETLSLENCAFEEVLSFGVSTCSEIVDLSLSQTTELFETALSDQNLASMLRNLASAFDKSTCGPHVPDHRSSPAPLRTFSLKGFASPSDSTLGVFAGHRFPFLEKVNFHCKCTDALLSESMLRAALVSRPYGYVRYVSLLFEDGSNNNNNNTAATTNEIQITPAIIRELAGSVAAQGAWGRSVCVWHVVASGDTANSDWEQDIIHPTPSSLELSQGPGPLVNHEDAPASAHLRHPNGVPNGGGDRILDAEPLSSSLPRPRTTTVSRCLNEAIGVLDGALLMAAHSPSRACRITVERSHGGRLHLEQMGEKNATGQVLDGERS